jgi:transcription antitermination protein NusB
MQTVYTLSTLESEVKPGEPVKLLQRHFEQSKDLLTYLTYFLTEIARYAETDAHIKSNKHLPTREDLNVNIKIAGNEILWKIKENTSFQQAVGKSKPEQKIDKELVRRIYHRLADTPQYREYMLVNERNHNQERDLLEFILNDLMLADEIFISHLEEYFTNWDDDAEMVLQTLKNALQKTSSANFTEVISPDKWEFAKTLLTTVLEKEKHLESFIVPKLKNWDAERIAALDMIIMKLGVAEFLYFETIPPKVTINEYIDIAKEYSTQQSGQFVNGILDNIHKELVQQNNLHKIDFKKA